MATTTAGSSKSPAKAKCCCPACTGLECLDRTRFFAGQLLTEADLNNEQSYWLAKSRLHNRFLHGWGVVCGLQVACSECDGWVTIKAGYAIDPCGNDIIVCTEQPFNVLKAIQACCAPPKQSNCSPVRAAPPAACQDTIQHWCITIQYQEQTSRLVTALKQTQSKTCGCGCGGTSHGGCGCGCGGVGAKNGSSKTATAAASTPGACEATRIIEGFTLSVCAEQESSQSAPSQGVQCITGVEKILLQAPDFSTTGNWTAQSAFQAACNYLLTVQNLLASSSLVHCTILDTVNGIRIVPIASNQKLDEYISSLNVIVTEIKQQLLLAAVDCLCLGLLPPCPPDPCDNRVCLACVSVQNGKIINVCNYGCRRQVVTFPALLYWLSLSGLDNVLNLLTAFVERVCCGTLDQRVSGLGTFNPREAFTTGGISNAGLMNRIASTILAQNLGASLVNAAAPQGNAVDLRPLVGQPTGTVNLALRQSGIENISTVSVDADPAWDDNAVAASTRFAPSAFPTQAALTIFTKGKLVVGFDVTNPTDILSRQVAALQQQVESLQQQLSKPK
ncbi:MAG TPA: hypothetical protein VMH81_31300 [Bryobacteraceae bacterium]|nr:hypothetical protein [Bryobacteraceae bacterium]